MKIQLKFGLIFWFAHFVNAADLDPIVGIIGGESIDIEQAPWQAYIEYFTKQTYGSRCMGPVESCGGSIIHEKWVLTAAHCTHIKDVIEANVRVGSAYSDKGGKIYQVGRIINHGRSSDDHFDFDFALLELTQAIKFDYRTIKPIALPKAYDFISPRKMCFVSGWGARWPSNHFNKFPYNRASPYSPYAYSQFPKKLHSVKVPLIPHAMCQQALSIYGLEVTKQMMCAGNGGKDACQGDSGGPLVCTSIDGEKKLFGIVSWGKDCGENVPGVYARVQSVRLWINKNTGV